jgi:ABC-2 type transport system permease protein
MQFYRIKAVMARHVLQMVKDIAKMLDMLYWPLVDIVLWGFTTLWFESSGGATGQMGLMVLTGLVLWGVIWRANIDISLCFLEELWSKNLVNLFSTPITLVEWSIGMMLLGLVRSVFIFFYAATLVNVFYGWNVMSLGFSLFIFFFLLLISGWSIGFFIAGFLAYCGQRIQSFVWAIGWIFSIIGAVFYPLEVMPQWVKVISSLFPISYIFEAMRLLVSTGVVSYTHLKMACILNLFYFFLALFFFKVMFDKSRARGLAHLEID